jgi:parallel beta-helix repeat protein
MMFTRALAAMLATASLSLTLASVASGARPVTLLCGQVITKDTKVANDLTNCPGNGLVIGADNVKLDLNGHIIGGDGAGDDSGIDNTGHDGVTITRGSVTKFGLGVLIAGASENSIRQVSVSDSHHVGIVVSESVKVRLAKSSVVASSFAGILMERGSSQVEIEETTSAGNGLSGIAVLESSDVEIAKNALTGNAAGVGVEGSPRTRIERNSVTGNSEDGVLIREGSDHSLVSENTVTENTFGVTLDLGSARNLVTHNSVRDNLVVGIAVVGSHDNRITQNSVTGNGDGAEGGIHLLSIPEVPGVNSDRNLITKNTLIGNDPDGILVELGQTGTVLEENRSSRNTDDGIDVDSAATTLTGNTADLNFDLGIEAVPGVTDGGGNKARGNGNPLQCTHVLCN